MANQTGSAGRRYAYGKESGKMRNGFCYYENGRPERISMRKAYRMFQTEVSEDQKNQGTTFSTWLFEMIKMQIFC